LLLSGNHSPVGTARSRNAGCLYLGRFGTWRVVMYDGRARKRPDGVDAASVLLDASQLGVAGRG